MISGFSPIGIFDSGLGGLSVLREVQRQLPQESVVYLADTANVPYGDKPIAVVRDLALRLTDHLVQRGCKLIIMASGTSTVAGLEAAWRQYPETPIFGTIDVGARVALQTVPGPVGVLATNATVQSLAFTRAVQSLSPDHPVTEQGCPRFVPLVESGRCETADALDASREYLRPLRQAGVRAIILGCTHFPFLLPVLHKASAEHAIDGFRPIFIDPAAEAVREATAFLAMHDLLASSGTASALEFAATGDPIGFGHYASLLLGQPLPPTSRLTL